MLEGFVLMQHGQLCFAAENTNTQVKNLTQEKLIIVVNPVLYFSIFEVPEFGSATDSFLKKLCKEPCERRGEKDPQTLFYKGNDLENSISVKPLFHLWSF